jgi:hypothetical protein
MTVGRVSSAVLAFAVVALALIATVFPGLAHVGPIHVVDWFGLMIYLAVPITWISAILHWAMRFPREGPRVLWGLLVVLGFVPGAVAYWFWGVRHSIEG